MDANPPSPPTRGRFSLLTGPWHASSRVVATLVLAFLVFCNVPGQYVDRVRLGDFPPLVAEISTDAVFEHGWPLTYVARGHDATVSGPEIGLRECFALWQNADEVQSTAVIVNILAVLSMAFAIGVAFEAWRRQRVRFLQFHVRDLLAVLLIVSAIGALYLNKQRAHAERKQIMNADEWPDDDVDAILYCSYYDAPCTWLRVLLGNRPFECLDRPLAVIVSDDKGWSELSRFPSLRWVEGIIPESTEDLKFLKELPRLEALSLDQFGQSDPHTVDIPTLPGLRGLSLESFSAACRGIRRAPSLEVLAITRSKIDDQTIAEIATLRQLRELSLDSVELTPDRLATLSALSNLRSLELEWAILTADSLRSLSRLESLTCLRLHSCRVVEGNISGLASFRNLQTLDLTATKPLVSSDLAPLAELPHLRELYLAGTLVDRDALEHLAKLKQLRLLALPRRGFTDADEKRLRKELPLCEIHFER